MLLFFLKGINFSVKVFFFLQESALLTLQIAAAFFIFTFHFAAHAVDFFFSFHQRFFAFGFTGLLGILNNADCSFFGSGYFAFGNIFADKITDNAACSTSTGYCNEQL